MKYPALAIMGLLTVTGLSAGPQLGQPSDFEERVVEVDEFAEDTGEYQRKSRRGKMVVEERAVTNPEYKVVMKSTSENRWAAIRYDARTGKSWRMMDSQWLLIKELKQLKPTRPSRFIVKLDHTVKERYCALRMDQTSGQCWALKEGTWVPILEEE